MAANADGNGNPNEEVALNYALRRLGVTFNVSVVTAQKRNNSSNSSSSDAVKDEEPTCRVGEDEDEPPLSASGVFSPSAAGAAAGRKMAPADLPCSTSSSSSSSPPVVSQKQPHPHPSFGGDGLAARIDFCVS